MSSIAGISNINNFFTSSYSISSALSAWRQLEANSRAELTQPSEPSWIKAATLLCYPLEILYKSKNCWRQKDFKSHFSSFRDKGSISQIQEKYAKFAFRPLLSDSPKAQLPCSEAVGQFMRHPLTYSYWAAAFFFFLCSPHTFMIFFISPSLPVSPDRADPVSSRSESAFNSMLISRILSQTKQNKQGLTPDKKLVQSKTP